MREAIGGSWLMYIFIVFLFVMIYLLACTLNYIEAYRTNNAVVMCIEDKDAADECMDQSIGRSFNYYGDIIVKCEQNSPYGSRQGAIFTVTTNTTITVPILGIDINIPINNVSQTLYDVDCPSVRS